MKSIVTALLVLASCGRVSFDPLVGSTDAQIGAMLDAMLDAPITDGRSLDGLVMTGDGGLVCACADESIRSLPGSMIAQGVPASNHGLSGSCGGAAGAEVVISVTAVAAGSYRIFDALGGVNTMYVRDGCCGGVELACVSSSTLTITLAADQQIVAIADGATVGQTVIVEVDAP